MLQQARQHSRSAATSLLSLTASPSLAKQPSVICAPPDPACGQTPPGQQAHGLLRGLWTAALSRQRLTPAAACQSVHIHQQSVGLWPPDPTSARVTTAWGQCIASPTFHKAHKSNKAADVRPPGVDSSVSSSDWGPGTQQLNKSLERLFLEAYKLLQEDKPEQAEQLVQDGITTAEEVREPEPLGLAQLKDQLALLQYVRGDLKRAEKSAEASLKLAKDSFSKDAPIAAMCQLRLGSILTAMDRYEEALPLLKESRATLEHSMSPDYPAAAEARFFIALCHTANPLLEAEKHEIYNELEKGLQGMQKHEGAGEVLVTAAIRGHHQLIDAALTDKDWGRAKALYQQEVRLHDTVVPISEALANVTYQLSTFLYVRENLLEARAIGQRSIDLCEYLYPDGDDHIHLRKHRMGTICVAEDNFERAELLLDDTEKHFQHHLGPRHPLTGEAQLCLALARIRLLDAGIGINDPFTKVLAPSKRREHVRSANAGLKAMRNGYGDDHMLVEKASALHKKLLCEEGA